jgi:membrane protein required for beta-lactamase induction
MEKEDMIRAGQFLDNLRQFLAPLQFFFASGRPALLQRVEKAIFCKFQRHLGTGVKANTGVQFLFSYLEWARLHLASANAKDKCAAMRGPHIEDRLERAASSIVSVLQNLP